MDLNKLVNGVDEIFTAIPQYPTWDLFLCRVLIILYSEIEDQDQKITPVIDTTIKERLSDMKKMNQRILKYPNHWELDTTPIENRILTPRIK